MLRLPFPKLWVLLMIPSALALQNPDFITEVEDVPAGSPLYNCHEACEEVIVISHSSNFCRNSTFTSDLSSCLKCALTYNIWEDYGTDVKKAANSCNEDATPSYSSSISTASSTTISSLTASATDSVTATASTTHTSASTATNIGSAVSLSQNVGLSIISGIFAAGILS